ncbi:hypothetical protein I79_004484 [Cricetulus griseus]|uniref:Uncharacterized protein n=1 Tax=Cricetulus griseus TaxID=10029 RepID=G3H2R5_CRIGR|nr:hypothetical protein I79_004484 [Cricetulus griseus]
MHEYVVIILNICVTGITYQSIDFIRLFVHHQQCGLVSTLPNHFHHTVMIKVFHRLAIDSNYQVIVLQASCLCWASRFYVLDDLTYPPHTKQSYQKGPQASKLWDFWV